MLKKIITPLIAVIFFCYFWQLNSKPLFSDYGKTFEIYSATKSAGEIKFANGFDFLTTFCRYGESVSLTLTDKENSQEFINQVLIKFNAKKVAVEKFEWGVSTYAYSKDIKYVEVVGGKRVNLHIFIGQAGDVTLGSPIIYGSF